MDNDINNNSVPTSGNFFYNDYGIKHFITLNGLILIKIAKNIVMSINNNAFTYGLTSSIEPSIEPGIVRCGNNSNRSSNNKGKSATYFYNNININIGKNAAIVAEYAHHLSNEEITTSN